MRMFGYVLMGFLGGIGMMTIFQDAGQTPSITPSVSYAMPVAVAHTAQGEENANPWTSKDLLEMAKIYDQQADELQSEAVRIEQRALNLAQQPHTDPKGFARTGFMHIAASRWKAARDLREMAVMHRSEGQRLLALEKSGETDGQSGKES